MVVRSLKQRDMEFKEGEFLGKGEIGRVIFRKWI